RIAGHFLVDSHQAPAEALDVVGPIAIVPDILDNLLDGAGGLIRRILGESGGVFEIVEQAAVEAVERGEMRLARGEAAEPSAATKHLLPQDAGFNRTQKHDEFEVR